MLEPLEWEFEKLKNPYSLKKCPLIIGGKI